MKLSRRAKPRRKATGAKHRGAPRDIRLPPRILSGGVFVFRFSGFCVAKEIPFHLTGIGQFVLDNKKILSGTLKSSITQMQGQDAALQHSVYDFFGTWDYNNDLLQTATLTFHSPNQTETGTFDLVQAESPNHFWLISSGAKVEGQAGLSGYEADEVVSGEAIKIA